MRILIIQPWISYRGAESISLDEARGFRSLGHKASILCLYVDKERLKKNDLSLDFILPPKFIARFCQRSNIFFFVFGFFILLILVLINGRKFDVYNPHNFPGVWVAVLVSYIYKKPVFWTVHNFPQHGFTDPVALRAWERLTWNFDQAVVKRIRGIICVSEKVCRQIYKNYKREAKVVLPSVDFAFFSQGRRSNLVKSLKVDSLPMVLIAAKLHEFKNPMLALKAIKRFLKKGRKAFFVFAGEGSMLAKLICYCRKNKLEQNVRLLGFVSKEELRNLYKTAEFVFLPGFFGEGFNVVVLEALCTGTPSLVLKGSGIDRWLKDSGLGFVVAKSEKKIADAFNYLINHKSVLSKAGRKGRKVVKGNHTPEKYAQILLGEFRSKV